MPAGKICVDFLNCSKFPDMLARAILVIKIEHGRCYFAALPMPQSLTIDHKAHIK